MQLLNTEHNRYMKELHIEYFLVKIFLYFSYRGTSRHHNCFNEHFLVTKIFLPQTSEQLQNEAGHHLVFSRQGVSRKNEYLSQFYNISGDHFQIEYTLKNSSITTGFCEIIY